MIDREKLSYYNNILNIGNKASVDDLEEVLTLLKKQNDIDFMKKILTLSNGNIDFSFLDNVFSVIKDEPNLEQDLLDSFSNNQIASKTALLEAVDTHTNIDKNSTVVIWGSWYGSILVPMLADKVKKILCIDLDNEPLQIAKNRLFPNYENIEYVCDNVFNTYRDAYLDVNLIINTSCEHMPPMNEWEWFKYSAMATDTVYPRGYADNNPSRKKIFKEPKLSDNCYFAFQSNNMFGIEGHINCVNSIDEFKEQLPERAEVLYQEEVEDTRGTRYMLVGRFMPL